VVAAEGDAAKDAAESEEAKKPAESPAVNCANHSSISKILCFFDAHMKQSHFRIQAMVMCPEQMYMFSNVSAFQLLRGVDR